MAIQEIASKILRLLKAAESGAKGNTSIQKELDIGPEQFYAARQRLINEGKVETGRGRGGSTRLISAPLVGKADSTALSNSQYAWRFTRRVPGNKQRESTSDTHFSRDLVAKLVREAVQNSLDASLDAMTPVRMRFALSMVPSHHLVAARQFVAHIEDRLATCQDQFSSSRIPRYRQSAQMWVLLVEDFNTRGLEGDPLEWEKPSRGNGFYHFFHGEGVTAKGRGKRGSFGMGKVVFFQASRVRSFFGLTNPVESQHARLMGQSLLASHEYDGKMFTPDGYWGESVYVESDGSRHELTIPCTDPEILDEFRRVFGLERVNEPGLSVVIPLVDGPKYATLAKVIVEQFGFAIASGVLAVDVATANHPSMRLDENTLINAVKEVVPDNALELGKRINAWFALAALLSGHPQNSRNFLIPLGGTDRKELAEIIPIASFVEEFRQTERLEFTVEFVELSGSLQSSRGFLAVLVLAEVEGRTGHVRFYRQSLEIPSAFTSPVPGATILIATGDGWVADTLREMENPSHTEWNLTGDLESSPHARQLLSDVVGLPRLLVEALRTKPVLVDKGALASFFPRMTSFQAKADSIRSTSISSKGGGATGVPQPDVPASNGAQCVVQPAEHDGKAGIAIRIKSDSDKMTRMALTVGYAGRSGKLMWRSFDFQFVEIGANNMDSGVPEVTVVPSGCTIVGIKGNVIAFDVTGTCRMVLLGLHRYRDVVVDLKRDIGAEP
jgi:hypothetical protein